jgi:hypothetical protein
LHELRWDFQFAAHTISNTHENQEAAPCLMGSSPAGKADGVQ